MSPSTMNNESHVNCPPSISEAIAAAVATARIEVGKHNSEVPFLRLPRELRDAMYTNYLVEEDGCAYKFETNRLTRHDGA